MSDGRDMEEALIGAVLKDGLGYELAREVVQPEHFHNWNYQEIWNACEHLHERGLGIDTLTVGDELERMGSHLQQGQWSDRALLSWLRDEGEPENVMSYAENVQDYATKRQLDTFLTKAVIWAKNGRRASDIMKDVTNELSKITLFSVQDQYTVPVKDAVSEAYELTDRASRGEVVGIPTGYTDLDSLLAGFLSQNVYLVAARTGQGKTAMLLQMALHAAEQKKNVAVFSLEMSRAQVAQRLIAQKAEIDLLRGIIRGKMEGDEWDRYHRAIGEIESLPITINDLSSININQIRQTARKLNPDIVFVDYIQLADSGEKRTERRELDVSAVSRGLKYLARELNIPVVAAAQLSRAIEQRSDKRPILADLRESGSLEQDAYCVLFLYRPDDVKQNVVEVIVAKHRNGPTGSIELIFRNAFAKFENAYPKYFAPNDDGKEE